MSSHVPRHVFVNAAFLGNHFQVILAVGIAGDRQKQVAFGYSLILLDNLQRYVLQPYVTFHSRFLSIGLNPQVPVERELQVVLRKIFHVNECKSRKSTKKEKVTDQFISLFLNVPSIRSLISSFDRKPRFVSSFVML